MLQCYIIEINYMECQPNECPHHGYTNQEVVEHFKFTGDGEGDFREVADDAPPELVKEYMGYCKIQAELCKKYLAQLEEKDKIVDE